MAQTKVVVIVGKVTDSETLQPLSRCNITVSNSLQGTTTDKQGNYSLKVKKRTSFELNYSFVGYGGVSKKVTPKDLCGKEIDTVRLDVQLNFLINILPPVDIGASKPDTVIGTAFFSISDFEFRDKQFVCLAYEKNLRKGSKVILADKDNIELHSVRIPDWQEAQEMYKDHMGRVWVICKEKAYLIDVQSEALHLQGIPKDTFEMRIRPAIDTLENQILFSDYRWYHPEMNLYSYNPYCDSVDCFAHVEDSTLARNMRMEYYRLHPKDKIRARQIAIETGEDKHYVGGRMAGYHQSIYYTPLYAPLFVIDDTIMVFDHYENKLYKFNEYKEVVDSISIRHHQPEKAREWKRKLLIDERNDKIYAVYQRQGYYYLNRVSTSSGKVTGSFRLFHKYVENMRIKDDYVYYVYRPYESLQKKYLYKELIKEE